MQLGFFFDQTKCTGCLTCVVACKDWHDIPAGPASWLKVNSLEKGEFPKVSVCHMVRPCYHCAEPSCVEACEFDALIKRNADGIVVVDKDLCVACRECEDACPYNAPQFAEDGDPEMQKCDFCLDRWKKGKKPICVEACPTRALDAGPMDELREKYGDFREANGFVYDKNTRPSVIFKSKK